METKINSLSTSNSEMLTTIKNLKESTEGMKLKTDLNECYNHSFDIASLFALYYIEPTLKTHVKYKQSNNNWRKFEERISVIKREITEQKSEQDDLDHFIRPVQDELDKHGIDLLILHEMIQERNLPTHERVRSDEEQKRFLRFLDNYNFTNEFKYCSMVLHMIQLIKQIPSSSLKRLK
jgi:peptidoglycan hydrolase CwlO-like protein